MTRAAPGKQLIQTYGAGGNKNYAVHGRKNLDDVMVILFLMYAVDLVAEHFEMVP